MVRFRLAASLTALGLLAGACAEPQSEAGPALQPTAASTSAAPASQTPTDAPPLSPSPFDTSGLVGRLIEALPDAEEPSHGLRIDRDCSVIGHPCVDVLGLGVHAVADPPAEPAFFRIAIYPTSTSESATDPQWAFDGAKERCRPGPFDHPPNLDPRGIILDGGRNGQRGTTSELVWQPQGWQTVSCIQDLTEYMAQPGTEPSEVSYTDIRDEHVAYSAGLGRTEEGEPVLVIVSASDTELLAQVRDSYLDQVDDGVPSGG